MQQKALASTWNEASSVDEARLMVGRAFRENRIEARGRHPWLGLYGQRVGSSGLVVVATRGSWEVDPAPNGDFVVEHLGTRGSAGIGYGDRRASCSGFTGVVISATTPTSLRLERDAVLLGLRVDVAALEAHLRLLTDRSPCGSIEFALNVDLRRGAGARRRRLIESALRYLPEHGTRDCFASALEDAYLTELLTGQPHSQGHLLEIRQPAVDLRIVRRVEEYIQAHPEHPIRSETLVALSGVCTTALYDAFRRLRGTTPMRLLRDRRLDRAREQLLREPDTTVTGAALDWGFEHLARFSAFYARRFGELPRETLARARRGAA